MEGQCVRLLLLLWSSCYATKVHLSRPNRRNKTGVVENQDFAALCCAVMSCLVSPSQELSAKRVLQKVKACSDKYDRVLRDFFL